MERSGVDEGLCHLFIHHTSASLIVCENADPTVRRDLESYAARLAPDGDPSYVHDSEGPDDMSAHIRSILTLTSLTIPVESGRCDLGTWQGIFLLEHRTSPHRRRITGRPHEHACIRPHVLRVEQRQIDLIGDILGQTVLMNVASDSSDRQPVRPVVDGNLLADRILARPIGACEPLADDHGLSGGIAPRFSRS